MPAVQDILITVRTAWEEWMRTRWVDLEFDRVGDALLVFVVLLALAVLVLLVGVVRRKSARARVVLPALLPIMHRSPLSLVRHLPVLLFVAGFPFFAIALADPLTGFAREEVLSRPSDCVARRRLDQHGHLGSSPPRSGQESTFFRRRGG
jgi:hypothetical protein